MIDATITVDLLTSTSLLLGRFEGPVEFISRRDYYVNRGTVSVAVERKGEASRVAVVVLVDDKRIDGASNLFSECDVRRGDTVCFSPGHLSITL